MYAGMFVSPCHVHGPRKRSSELLNTCAAALGSAIKSSPPPNAPGRKKTLPYSSVHCSRMRGAFSWPKTASVWPINQLVLHERTPNELDVHNYKRKVDKPRGSTNNGALPARSICFTIRDISASSTGQGHSRRDHPCRNDGMGIHHA